MPYHYDVLELVGSLSFYINTTTVFRRTSLFRHQFYTFMCCTSKMPFPKEWDSKAKIMVFPFRQNNGVLCYNCQQGWPRDRINMFTGLCERCRQENPVPMQTRINGSGQQPRKGEPCCKKCFKQLKHTNFGICRPVCEMCKVEEQPLKQRCMGCNKFFKDCWNNLCRRCRFRGILCDEVGYFYSCRERHRINCWCINRGEQSERQEENMQGTSAVAND